MPPKLHRLLIQLFVLLPALVGLEAQAALFGELRTATRVGELLQAEIDIDEESPDHFSANCVKLFRPQQLNGDAPWIADALLSFRRENGKGKLFVSSDKPVLDALVQLGIQSNCIGNPGSREYVIAPSPARNTERAPAVEAGGRANAALVLPAAVKKTAAAAALVDRGPRLASGAITPLALPQAARPAALVGSVPVELQPFLRMTARLDAERKVSAVERDILRLEYHLLTALHAHAENQLEVGESLRRLAAGANELNTASQRLGVAPPGTPAAVPAPATDAPQSAQNKSAEAAARAAERATKRAAAVSPDESDDWLLVAGVVAALAFVLLVVFAGKRRRLAEAAAEARARADAAAEEERLASLRATTEIVIDPDFSRAPDATGVELVEISTPATAALPPVPVDFPPIPEKLEASPVMELAEIMLSFGRFNGAAQMLQEYIQANPKEALQPWIRLLEIYRDNDMREEFESLATNLNQNFNVEIVRWGEAAGSERVELTLELLPHIRDQVDTLWGKPECLEYLQKLLRDNRGGERNGFSLPVVQELLFLIDLMVTEKAAANNEQKKGESNE